MITVKIAGVDYTKYVVYPITLNSLLDERLDEGRMTLEQVPSSSIPECAAAEITMNGETLDFIVSGDVAVETPPGSGKYKHELSIIETTKLLEGVPVETLTFQNSRGRNYIRYPIKAEPSYE